MKALISPAENNRIVEVKTNSKVFPIAEPLYWVDCPNNCTTEWSFVNGNFVQPVTPEPIVVIPTTVSMYQAREALRQSGLLMTVNQAIAGGTEADQIKWEYATEVNRNDALVANMATALNLSATDLDALFTLASTL